MIRTIFPVTVAVCLVISGCAAPLAAQSASVRQVAYLKASNPAMYAHFGEGGALPGHTGNTVSISADGNTIAVGAPHEASARHRDQRQPERRLREQRRRRVRLHAQRRELGAAGVRQGVERRQR